MEDITNTVEQIVTSTIQPKDNIEKLDEEFFIRLPNVLINDLREKKIKALDLAVYAVFASRLGKHKSAWPGNKSVARTVGTSVRNLCRCLVRLQKAGHINRCGKAAFGTKHTFLPFLNNRTKNGEVIKPCRISEISADSAPSQSTRPMDNNDIYHSNEQIEEYLSSDKPVIDLAPLPPQKPQTDWEYLNESTEEDSISEYEEVPF